MLPCRHLFRIVLLLACCSDDSVLMAQSAVWGLKTADRFTVQTTISQTTTVTLDDAPPVTTRTTESFHVEYRVERLLPAETHFYVQITKAETPDKSATVQARQRLRLLEQAVLRIAVDHSGVARIVGGYDESISKLADRDESTLEILKTAYASDVFASWVTRPFWMTAPGDTPEKGDTWERLDNVSLGLMGTLRTVANCELSSIEDNAAQVTVSGRGRYVPHPVQPSSAASTFTFSDVTTKTITMTGEGKLWFPPETPDNEDEVNESRKDVPQQPELRPGFESLTLQWNLEGTAKLNVGAKKVSVSFRETQTQETRLLPGSHIRTQTPAFRLPGRR